jgi:MtrB/PioB family decaheme-associated outer membrane protein
VPQGFGLIPVQTSPFTGPGGVQFQTALPTAAQLADFHDVNVYNQRQNTTLNASYAFNDQWSVKLDYNHLNMTGAKLIAASSDSYAINTNSGERISYLLNPIQSSTDTVNVSVNWVGDNAYGTGTYSASIYQDAYNDLMWQSPFGSNGVPNTQYTNYMGTPPDNLYQQLQLTGGYIFSRATKVSGSASVALSQQNDSYSQSYTPGTVTDLPASSLDGQVRIFHADGRLTHQFNPKLGLNTGFRFDERDNNTSSRAYSFIDLTGNQSEGGAPVVAINTPTSNQKADFDATLNYRLDSRQRLSAGYAYEHIDRWCKNSLANTAQGAVAAAYYVDASCVQSPHSSESKGTLGYSLNLLDDVNFKANYTYADRDSSINQAFYNPMQATANGYETYGFLSFFQASRRENLYKASVTWQATSKFSIGLDARYTNDDYYDNELGVQGGNSSSYNIDASYAFSDKYSIGAYASWQKNGYNMLGATSRSITPTTYASVFQNALNDRQTALGLDAKQKFFGDRFNLREDVSLALGRSAYNTAFVAGAGTALNTGSAGPITSRSLRVRVIGSYKYDKASTISLGLMYDKLSSADYYYNALQYGYAATQMMMSNQISPYYSITTVFVSYRYSFL